MLTLVYEGRTYNNFSVADLLAAGVPQAAIDAHIASLRLTAIKAECRRRIYAEGSAEAQMNVAAVCGVIREKSASSRSAQEAAILAGQKDAVEWVAAMRANIDTLASNTADDFTADASWPECPATTIAVYDQF